MEVEHEDQVAALHHQQLVRLVLRQASGRHLRLGCRGAAGVQHLQVRGIWGKRKETHYRGEVELTRQALGQP